MKRSAIPLLLPVCFALLSPRTARADDDVALRWFVGIALIGTAAAITGITVPTVYNTRNWRQERDPSWGWVGLGGASGLLFLAGGASTFRWGLGRSSPDCPVDQDKYSGRCNAAPDAPLLAVGAIAGAMGAFALSMAIASAVTHAPEAHSAGAPPMGPSPARFSLTLPTLKF